MKTCIKCGDGFPASIIVDGKRRNLKNRTKCLKCLPFGESPYATSNLSEEEKLERYRARKRKNSKNNYARYKDKIEQKSRNRRQFLVSLIGGCQNCGYQKGSQSSIPSYW